MKNILFLAAASLMSLLSYAQEQTKVYMVSNILTHNGTGMCSAR